VGSGRRWRRRVGVTKSTPWSRIGPYFPDTLLDGGEDAPLDRRGRTIWLVVIGALVVAGIVFAAVLR
jgi:hypothetical protein